MRAAGTRLLARVQADGMARRHRWRGPVRVPRGARVAQRPTLARPTRRSSLRCCRERSPDESSGQQCRGGPPPSEPTLESFPAQFWSPQELRIFLKEF